MYMLFEKLNYRVGIHVYVHMYVVYRKPEKVTFCAENEFFFYNYNNYVNP